MLTRSVEEAAVAAGCSCIPERSWRLLVNDGANTTLVGVTPRLPTATDLQQLDEARDDLATGGSALLVHSARMLRAHLKEHLTWVAGGRNLVLLPENGIGGRWT